MQNPNYAVSNKLLKHLHQFSYIHTMIISLLPGLLVAEVLKERKVRAFLAAIELGHGTITLLLVLIALYKMPAVLEKEEERPLLNRIREWGVGLALSAGCSMLGGILLELRRDLLTTSLWASVFLGAGQFIYPILTKGIFELYPRIELTNSAQKSQDEIVINSHLRKLERGVSLSF